MPEDGIVLGKDGSLMAGWVYEGEDEASRTDEEQALVSFGLTRRSNGSGTAGCCMSLRRGKRRLDIRRAAYRISRIR